MKTSHRYKITVEDESRLETIASYSASPLRWALRVTAVALGLMAIGSFIVFMTPARTLLPGYLKDSERAETMMQLMRLDSLKMAYNTNAAFLDNILNVLNPDGSRNDTTVSFLTIPLSPDSLPPASPEEERFMSMMREREKYNISVIAPLASESLLFYPLSEESVFPEDSRKATRAEVIIARGAPLSAIADGTVIAVSQTIRDGGTTVIIQHPKGFLSRTSRLGNVLVEPGDVVTGGQVIALPNRGNGRNGEKVAIEMWYNGDPIPPYDYIGEGISESPRLPVIDTEVGRGRL